MRCLSSPSPLSGVTSVFKGTGGGLTAMPDLKPKRRPVEEDEILGRGGIGDHTGEVPASCAKLTKGSVTRMFSICHTPSLTFTPLPCMRSAGYDSAPRQ